MREAHVHADTSVTIENVPPPKISAPNDVLIRVVCASCNPKDWKMPAGMLKTLANCPNSGDDLAGIVHEVGSAVTAIKPGDRVAALHELGAPHGAYAEYALVKDFICFKLPQSMGFAEGSTMPMAFYMACVAFFGCLRVCEGPWEKVHKRTPLLIYGASSGVGSMSVKLAQVVGVHPLICVAGSGSDFVEGLIDRSKGDVVLDYRKGEESFVANVRSVLGNEQLEYALDAISEPSSIAMVAKALKPSGGKIALTLPGRTQLLPQGLEVTHVMAGSLWRKLEGRDKREHLGNLGLDKGGPEFAAKMTDSLSSMLSEGVLEPHPYTVWKGGLDGLEAPLKALREGKVSSSRCVVRIADP